MGTGSTFKPLLDEEEKAKSVFKIEYSASGYALERPHLVCRKKNSRAFFFRVAFRLSQALRHLGQDQRAGGGKSLDIVDDVALT